MRVLVTGATGFIGRHVVRELISNNHLVTVLVRDPEKAFQFDWSEQVSIVKHNIHSSEKLSLNQSEKIDAVVHLAWAGLPNYKAMFHIEENLPADYRFIKSLITQGVGQFLIAGTCSEYGMQAGCLAESAKCYPAHPYALAKHSLHEFLLSLKKEHPFVLQWARLFYMYGEGQHHNSLLSQLDRAIDSGVETFEMSGGEQLRDYLPVEEVARRLVSLLQHRDACGTYNICNGQPISIRRLVENHLAYKRANIDLSLGRYPYTDYEPMSFWGDSRKLDALLER